jgi:hypothetical protein
MKKRWRFSLPIMGFMLGSKILGRCMEVSPLVKWEDVLEWYMD